MADSAKTKIEVLFKKKKKKKKIHRLTLRIYKKYNVLRECKALFFVTFNCHHKFDFSRKFINLSVKFIKSLRKYEFLHLRF